MPISAADPARKARGKLRCGLMVSPALKVAYCQPSYAQSTLIIARPKPDAQSPALKCTGPGRADGDPFPNTSRAAPISKMAATLIAVVTFCRLALPRVLRTLIAAMTAITRTETSFAAIALS